jgi:GTPase SAR1 family protein
MTVAEMEEATFPIRLNKNELNAPIWQVIVIPSCHSPGNEFAVVVSLTHVIGDGYTFYQLHNMMCFAQDVSALVIDRIPDSDTQIQAVIGIPEFYYMAGFWYLLGAVIGIAYTVIKSLITRRPSMQQQVQWLDTNKIDLEKKKYHSQSSNDVPFVSTNDILSSWVCTATHVRESTVIVNFRNRLPGFTPEHAGNYISSLILQSDDFSTPLQVRQSVMQMKRIATSSHLPSALQAMLGQKVIVSNWVAFKKPCKLPCDSKEIFHVPLFNARTFPYHFGLVYLFVPSPGQLGLFCVGNPAFLKRLENGPFTATGTLEK